MISFLLATTPPSPNPTEWIWGMSPEAWLTILAIVLGPIVALWLQRLLDKGRERGNRKIWIFRELMSTRSTRISTRHVEALNAIEVEFYGKREADKKVVDAWKQYLDHLNQQVDENAIGTWSDKGNDLFIELLFAMSKRLGYDFDKVTLKRSNYFPKGHGELEAESLVVRKAVLDILTGKRKFPIDLYIPDEVIEFFKKAAEEQRQQQAQAAQPPTTEVTVVKATPPPAAPTKK